MKRFFAAMICLLLLLLLCGCGASRSALLAVGGIPVPRGVCAYQMDRVLADPGAFGAGEDDADSLRGAAVELCRQYAAVELLMRREQLTLSIAQKNEVAQRVRGLWQFFGKTYRRIGMKKADLTAVLENEAKMRRLVQWEYGAGGKNEVSQTQLLRLFRAQYIGYRFFSLPLTALSEAEAAAQKQAFETMALQINAGKSLNKVYAAYCRDRGLLTADTPELQVVRLDDPTADPALLQALQNTQPGKAVAAAGRNMLFLAQREEIASADSEAFLSRCDALLEKEKLPQMQERIRLLAQKSGAEQNERQMRALMEAVRRARSEAR